MGKLWSNQDTLKISKVSTRTTRTTTNCFQRHVQRAAIGVILVLKWLIAMLVNPVHAQKNDLKENQT